MRRVLIIVGCGLGGALLWAIIFGGSLLLGSDEPEDFLEQATFRTERVAALAGVAAAEGHCSESRDGNGLVSRHGTSYRVDLTWTGRDGAQRTGVMTTCEPPAEGASVTVWVSSGGTVFNRSPAAMYSSVPIAAVIFAAGAWGWTWLRRDDRARRTTSSGVSRRLRRRLRLAKKKG